MKKLLSIMLMALTLGLWHGAVTAAPGADDGIKKVVLQISDPNPFKQTLVLNVANNIIKHYGSDKVEVEIVAFGPGLRLLLDGNSNTGRIQNLSDTGVRFSACANTVKAFSKALEGEPKLNGNAVMVDAGVIRIVDLVDQGYILVKP